MGVLRAKVDGVWVDLAMSGSWVPVGGIIEFGGTIAPGGFMICNGNAVSRTTYAELFAAIGIIWGAGDGSTTFNLPNLCGRASIGAGQGTGLTNRTLGTMALGEEVHTLTGPESGHPGHTPTVNSMGTDSVDHSHTFNANTGYVSADHTHGQNPANILSNNPGLFVQNVASGYSYAWGNYSTGGISANHYHNVNGTTSGINTGHTHAVYMNAVPASSAGVAHNNMQPSAVVNKIIRVS